VVDLGVELHVGGKTVPEIVAGTSYESHGELALEHEDGDAEDGPLRQQLEDEGRGDLLESLESKMSRLSIRYRATNIPGRVCY